MQLLHEVVTYAFQLAKGAPLPTTHVNHLVFQTEIPNISDRNTKQKAKMGFVLVHVYFEPQ